MYTINQLHKHHEGRILVISIAASTLLEGSSWVVVRRAVGWVIRNRFGKVQHSASSKRDMR